MKCFHCEKDITWEKGTKEARYKLIAIDRPYINIFFHISCFYEIKGDLLSYFTERSSSVIELVSRRDNIVKVQRKIESTNKELGAVQGAV